MKNRITIKNVLFALGALLLLAFPHLAANRIFAKWLQKKVVFRAGNGTEYSQAEGFGPDALRIRVPEGVTKGTLEVFAEDGRTPIGSIANTELRAGARYEIVLD